MKVSASQTGRPLRLALVSCGLGNVRRGFEVSTARWYEVLKKHPGLDVRLFRGGKYDDGRLVLNIPRDFVLNSPLAVFRPINRQRYWEFCYGVEQISFGLFFWPDLVKFRPDIVWTKEVPFGYFLPAYRAALGLKCKVVFANGGAFRPQTYKDFDYIQHLTQESYDEAVAYGIPAHKMETLTNAVIYRQPQATKEELRAKLNYAQRDFVVMCVSAWNAYHKRLDYLIEEVASIGDPSVKLLLCGHPDAETGMLRQLGQRKLGERVQWRSMEEADVQAAMKAADVLVMASTRECLGNAIVEAVMAGLPVITHSHVASRFVLGADNEWMCDLTKEGALRDRILLLRSDSSAGERIIQSQKRIHDLFSPEALMPRFYDMVMRVHDGGAMKTISNGAGA